MLKDCCIVINHAACTALACGGLSGGRSNHGSQVDLNKYSGFMTSLTQLGPFRRPRELKMLIRLKACIHKRHSHLTKVIRLLVITCGKVEWDRNAWHPAVPREDPPSLNTELSTDIRHLRIWLKLYNSAVDCTTPPPN